MMIINRNSKLWVLSLISILILSLAISGCGAGDEKKEPAGKPSESEKAEPAPAPEDKWPERPIKMIVPFSAGGGSDRMSRALAPYLSKELGVDIVVENQPGAGSQVGLTNLLNQPADGYTVSQANQPHTSFTIAVQDAPYALDDLAWLNFQHIDPIAIGVLNNAPWKDLKEFIEYVKAHPGEVAVGATQMSGPHVFLLFLEEEYGLDFTIVPYPGGGEGRAALIGGHIDAYFSNAFASYSLKDQMRTLGIGWDERTDLWPDSPTFEEILGDPKLTQVAMPLASFRGYVFPKKFKDEYPERWEKFLKAYETAYHSDGHMADSEKLGQLPIMHWTGPEEAEKLSREAHEIVQKYAHFFEK